jgi:hypothetical protein
MKNTANIHHDNIATPGAPVWRRRIRKPFTCKAVRLQLIAQAADLPELEREAYVRRRLTKLDLALSDEQAEAVEEWLLCEEVLSGRVKISDYGDRTGGGSGRASPVPDALMGRLKSHARLKKHLSYRATHMLNLLQHMENPSWSINRGLLDSLCDAAAALVRCKQGGN